MRENDERTDRRRLLRRAGTLAAGVAGAGVAGAVAATPAQADDGQPVLQGRRNEAQNTTHLRSHAPNSPTLEVFNTFEDIGTGSGGAGPSLRLVPLSYKLYDEAPAGSLSADQRGIPWVSVQYPGQTLSHPLLTAATSASIVPITPTRAVDTRTADTRRRIVNPSVLDSAGRLPRNQTMHVNLSDLAFFPDAVILNATVTGQVTAGYLTVFPYLSVRPGIASLNYSPRQDLSNLVFTATGTDEGSEVQSGISVFASQLTHVILDVVGFVISSGAVNPAVLPTALAPAGGAAVTAAAERREQVIRRSKPSWE